MDLRQIVLDTETTGLEPKQGHRTVEIGCIEMINREFTGNDYHIYLNPQRAMDKQAEQVHGLSDAFLRDKPIFADIATKLIEYLDGAQLIIHNAPFDLGFLNHELSLFDKKSPRIERICSIIDTLQLARKKHPGQKNSLDALCKRYEVSNNHRKLHGALVDADLLARVYLAMTREQTDLFAKHERQSANNQSSIVKNKLFSIDPNQFVVVKASADELTRHQEKIKSLDKNNPINALWEE